MRVPRPAGGCHQCCTSPSTNWREAASTIWARQRSGRVYSSDEHVLQLIAESEGAAGLVRPTTRPDPATERLIQQPAVHQQIERIVGRAYLDRAERVVPEPFRARDRIVDGGEARVACGEFGRVRGGRALTEHERDAA